MPDFFGRYTVDEYFKSDAYKKRIERELALEDQAILLKVLLDILEARPDISDEMFGKIAKSICEQAKEETP